MRVIFYTILMIVITFLMSACLNPIEQTAIMQFRNKSVFDISVYITSGKNDISNSTILTFTSKAQKDKHITIRWKEYGNATVRIYWKYKIADVDIFARGDEVELKSGDEKPLNFD